MDFNVIVVNTAASSGGALTILKQFIEAIPKYSPKNINYHIFVSKHELSKFQNENINIIIIDDGNNYINRVFKEKKYIKQWCEKKCINPDLIISLQNIGINGFDNIPQIIYLHQPIPFRKDLNWSIYKRDEIRYWMYKNLYSRLIKKWCKKRICFIVQTNWMKKSLINDFGVNNNNVRLIRPEMEPIDISRIKQKYIGNDCINLFYPTSKVKYKNYTVLFDVMKKLNNRCVKYKLYITLNKEFVKTILKSNPEEYGIVCIDNIEYKEVLEYYKSVDVLLFPSYLETFGLPLVEAANFGLKIVAADLEYSREVLNGYDGATFAKYDEIDEWVTQIKQINLSKNEFHHDKDCFTGWDKMFDIVAEFTENKKNGKDGLNELSY